MEMDSDFIHFAFLTDPKRYQKDCGYHDDRQNYRDFVPILYYFTQSNFGGSFCA
jgi:hypothetical protein